MASRKLDWTNTIFLPAAHLLAVFAVVYMAAIHFSWWSLLLGFVWLNLCGFSITGGYHRLFAHRTYKARWFLRAYYLFFGAASVQNSALKWSADHRLHHSRTDRDEDPYNRRKGFWWSHIGWVFFADPADRRTPSISDLEADPLVRFQDRHYVFLVLLSAGLLPAALGLIWGDPIGAVLVAGFLRLVIQWHMTFSVNSIAHTIGVRPFSTAVTARDSFFTAIVTLGEGYHNFHHRFQLDYRNGVRWYHLDPTKWFVWLLARVGVTWDLRRTPAEEIQRARLAVVTSRVER